MALEKTNTKGVFKRVGKKDTTFYIRYRKLNQIKDESVGKKSMGMTETKAKRILNEKLILISRGEDEASISLNNKNIPLNTTSKMSLNKLSELYFDKFDKLCEDEKHLEKEDKKSKDIEGVRREKSLYKTFWKNWSLSLVPIYKLNSSHFIKHINEIQKEKKTVIRDSNEISVDRYSKKYILNGLILVKSIIKHTKCPHNPLENTEELEKLNKYLRKKSEPRKEYLEPNEIKLLLDTLKEKDIHRQGYLMCLILATTGMRPDSCLNLKIKDIDSKNMLIKTFDFKRKHIYYCNLTPLTLDELQILIRDRSKSEYLFFTDKTKGIKKVPRTPEYISDTISKLFNKNRYGSDRIVLYSLRHSFATNLVKGIQNEKGEYSTMPVSIFIVQKLLNHSKVDTTIKHYAHYAPNFAISAVKDLEEKIFF